jgi:hypothetical protein
MSANIPANTLRRQMHAALEVNIPDYASAMVTTNEVIDAISSPKS